MYCGVLAGPGESQQRGPYPFMVRYLGWLANTVLFVLCCSLVADTANAIIAALLSRTPFAAIDSAPVAHSQNRSWEEVGLQISRGQTVNRFDAMFESLCQLRERGFVPDVVVDAGANAGQWTKIAIQVFPEANFHLIEPQPACRSSLLQLTKAHSRLVYHSCAVTRAGVSQVTLAGGNKFGGSELDLVFR